MGVSGPILEMFQLWLGKGVEFIVCSGKMQLHIWLTGAKLEAFPIGKQGEISGNNL